MKRTGSKERRPLSKPLYTGALNKRIMANLGNPSYASMKRCDATRRRKLRKSVISRTVMNARRVMRQPGRDLDCVVIEENWAKWSASTWYAWLGRTCSDPLARDRMYSLWCVSACCYPDEWSNPCATLEASYFRNYAWQDDFRDL